MERFSDYGIKVPDWRRTGRMKVACPKCGPTRGNPRDPSLSVDFDKGLWNCHHCGWCGRLRRDPQGAEALRAEALSETARRNSRPAREWKKPKATPRGEFSPRLLAWLNGRGLSEATLKEAGVDEGEEIFRTKEGETVRRRVVRFHYRLEGEDVNVKSRTADKMFRLVSGARMVPWNIDSVKGTPEMIVTEGEFDALSFLEVGRPDVISVPNGANSNLDWLDDFMESHFEGKERIYIASDADPKGRELRDELVRRLGAGRCWLVEYPEGCKDANEVLQAYGKESLLGCLEQAREIPVPGLYGVGDYEQELDDLYLHGQRRGMTVGHRWLDEMISFETKRLAVVTGIPSSGKSEFIDELCVRLNVRHGLRVAYFSPENMPLSYHATKIIEKLTGERLSATSMSREDYEAAKEYAGRNFFHILPPGGYTLSAILDGARTLVRRRGVKILVIDPFNRIEPDPEYSRLTETQAISLILDRLTNIAQELDLLVILMVHPRKVAKDNGNNGVPTMYDINGSANFYNKADYGLVVHRDRAAGYTLVAVEKVKFRHLGQGGRALFRFDVRSGRYNGIDPDSLSPGGMVTAPFIPLPSAPYRLIGTGTDLPLYGRGEGEAHDGDTGEAATRAAIMASTEDYFSAPADTERLPF
ncbi:MAG: toprim domain-containing protein [Pseudoflavonifractor sp.]|nr:toprim domain-containing protein [Alloprevotella sp.]MCM1117629.1 toprim domain-containing protein [Pseudoflavonifractor sp.]